MNTPGRVAKEERKSAPRKNEPALSTDSGKTIVEKSSPDKSDDTPKPPDKDEGPKTPGKPALPAGSVEVRFTDNSTLKLVLRDERLSLASPYGKLSIPVADIRRIDFATRISEEAAKRKAEGLTFTDATPADYKKGAERMAPYWDEWAKNKGADTQEALKKVREALGR